MDVVEHPLAHVADLTLPRGFVAIVLEARDILRGSAGFCLFLGLAFGFMFGYELPLLIPGQFELMTQLVLGLVLGKSATVSVAVIMALRMAFRFRYATIQHWHPQLLIEVLASIWGMFLSYGIFIIAAVAGFALGMEVSGTVSGETALFAIEQHYSLPHLLRGLLRLLVEAVLLGWLAYSAQLLAQWLTRIKHIQLQPSPVLLLGGFIAGLIMIEIVDARLASVF